MARVLPLSRSFRSHTKHSHAMKRSLHMMPDTTYYGQPSFVPPQLLLQGLFGQLHGQHAQPFGGFPPQGLFGHLPSQYGHQPFWPPFGFAPQNPLALLSSLYGQHPIWPSIGGGFGPFAP